MKIATLETFTNQFVCFVRVTSDSGATGWGQTSTYNADITQSMFYEPKTGALVAVFQVVPDDVTDDCIRAAP